MNMNSVYKIKKTLKTPMVLAVIMSIPVFYDVVAKGYEWSMLIMALMLIVLYYLLTLNNLIRRVRIQDNTLVIINMFGIKRLPTEDISLIDGMTIGTRQFINISSKKKSFLIPNSFENFPGLIDDITSIAKKETIGGGLQHMRENLVNRKSDTTVAWITVLLLMLIILVRFFPMLS